MSNKATNVILSVTLKPLVEVIRGATSLQTLQQVALENENIFLFNNTANSNLLQFKHTWKSDGVGKGKSEQVMIEVLDPTYEFERLFARTRFNDLLPKMYKNINEESQRTQARRSEKIESYVNELRDSSVFSLSERVKDFAPQSETKLTLWAAYGVGDEFEHWSAPMRLEFSQAEIKYNNDGVRVLTLFFVTFTNLIRDTKNSIFGPINKLESKVRAISEFRYETERVQVAPQQDPERKLGRYDPIVDSLEWANKFTTVRTPTELFQGVLIDYISKVYDINSSRVLIVYPKIEVMFRELLERNQKSLTRKEDRDNIPELDQLSVYQESVVLKNFFKYLNFTINIENTVEGETTNPAEVAYKNDTSEIIRTEGNPFVQNRTFARRQANSNFRLEINTTTDTSNFDKILDTLERNSDLDTNIVIHQQTNPDIINVLEKYNFVPESSEDPEPVIIFGDTSLIRKYIYADLALLGVSESTGLFADLNPDLQDKLKNQEYHKEMLLARPDISRSNYVPDNLFSPIDKSAAEIINKSRLPVFRYGTQNPNVIKLNLDINKILTNAYQQLPELSENNRVSWGTTNFNTQLTNRFKSYNQEGSLGDTSQLKSYIQSILVEALEGKVIEPEFEAKVRALGTASDEEFLNILSVMHANIAKSSPATFKVLNELSGDTALANTIRTLSAIFIQSFTGKITTTPMFWLSNPSLISSNCFLFALNPSIVGVNVKSPIQAIYTGVYTLVGFSHTISVNTVESEFEIVKNLQNTTAEELEELSNSPLDSNTPEDQLLIEDPGLRLIFGGGNEDSRLRRSGGS